MRRADGIRKGLDWHGPSAEDAWASLDALTSILGRNPAWHPWKLKRGTKAVVLGHSNGGHGAWYLASRYPDRVLGGSYPVSRRVSRLTFYGHSCSGGLVTVLGLAHALELTKCHKLYQITSLYLVDNVTVCCPWVLEMRLMENENGGFGILSTHLFAPYWKLP